MTLRNLEDGEMIATTATWTDKARGRGVFETYPLLAAMLPSVDEAHDLLLTLEPAPGASDREQERTLLYQQGVVLDQRHDRKGRGVFNLLGALADLSDDADEAAQLLALRKRLFVDDNLKVLKATWSGEAGNAQRLHTHVLSDKEVTAALKAVPLPGKRTLLDGTKEFVTAGLQLGALEDKRTALAAPLSEAATQAPSTTGAAARNRWISVVGTVVRLVDDVLRLPPAERHALLGGLDAAERKADARALARRGNEAVPEEPDAPANGTTGGPGSGSGGND